MFIYFCFLAIPLLGYRFPRFFECMAKRSMPNIMEHSSKHCYFFTFFVKFPTYSPKLNLSINDTD